MAQILHIFRKAVHMHHQRVAVFPEGAAMAPVVQSPDLVACLEHIVYALAELADGFGKAVADDDDAPGLVAAVVFIIDGLALDPFVQAGLPTLGQIGLHLGFHLLLILLLGDPMHGAASFSGACPGFLPSNIPESARQGNRIRPIPGSRGGKNHKRRCKAGRAAHGPGPAWSCSGTAFP